MDAKLHLEQALEEALAAGRSDETPPRLAAAMHYAVFPGGARVRPRLCLAVASACGADDLKIVDAAACAIEFLHCASLVHDDLPCFDDADLRRGKASVHRAFDERLAVLAGDALIVLAFETLARVALRSPERCIRLIQSVGASVGIPHGIVAGQAWECEANIDLCRYHQEKTGALFAGAAVIGAAAAGSDAEIWRPLGERLGEAYQVADDIRDVASDPAELGKPVGQDVALGRPSAARELGLSGAVGYLQDLVDSAVEAIPPCPGSDALRQLILAETHRFLPDELWQQAA